MVRPFDEGDLVSVGRVHALSRRAAYDGLVPAAALARVTPESQVDVWRERTSFDDTTVLVAEQGETVVGFVSLLQTPDGTELDAIHLLPDVVGTGAGSALMAAAVEHARALGLRTLHVFVVAGNERARAFYRRTGWKLTGPAGTHDIGGAEVDIVRYRLTLGSDL